MTAALAHRGPDGEGALALGAIALGHRRLAIIDVAGGAQPIWNEDRTVAVVFNGEIYNYRELREELRSRHRFATESDTEVLVHLYEELQEGLVGKLRGMFAFALWDVPRQRLLLARDHLGEKPLYYSMRSPPGGGEGSRAGPGTLYFASELPALRAGGAPLGELDRSALSDYLELLYIPAPRTVYAGARKLPAGHLLVADREGVSVRRFYRPPRPGSATAVPRAESVRALLDEAVRLRLRADVPVAALLSGGLDSSAVVALAAGALGDGVRTFAVGFGAPGDELPFARLIAERYRTAHSEIVLRDAVLEQALQGIAAFGEPFGDSSAVPTVAVCKAVAREVKVVLTGDGGDELFAGYGRYRQVARLPRSRFFAPLRRLSGPLGRLPLRRRSALRRAAAALGSSGGARYRALLEVFSPEERRALLGAAARASPLGEQEEARAAGAEEDVNAALQFDLGVYLPDDLLVKTDAASMRWGLEARAPLLDVPLAALAVPPPPSAKQDRVQGKLLLREAVRELLPAEILARPKRGFGSPVGEWLRGPLRGLFLDLLAGSDARLRRHLDGRAVARVVVETVSGRGNAHQGWSLLALELWLRGAA